VTTSITAAAMAMRTTHQEADGKARVEPGASRAHAHRLTRENQHAPRHVMAERPKRLVDETVQPVREAATRLNPGP
jgi:hypothetical protein